MNCWSDLPGDTIAKFIENKGAGVHHVAFAVEDGVANALAEAEGKEIRLIDKAPRKGAEVEYCFPSPEINFGRVDRTLRTLIINSKTNKNS